MYGKQLKEQRKAQNCTLDKVAKGTGISKQNLSRYERDEVEPQIHFCVLLANFYDISLDELIGRERHYTEHGDTYNVSNSGNITNSFNKTK